MKIIFRYLQPKNYKERMFKAEAVIEDELHNPAHTFVELGGEQYSVEVYFDPGLKSSS